MNIAFLGDSITFGYGLCDKSKRYATLIASELGMTEENYGICGTLMAKAGLNNSDELDFVSRMGLIESIGGYPTAVMSKAYLHKTSE